MGSWPQDTLLLTTAHQTVFTKLWEKKLTVEEIPPAQSCVTYKSTLSKHCLYSARNHFNILFFVLIKSFKNRFIQKSEKKIMHCLVNALGKATLSIMEPLLKRWSVSMTNKLFIFNYFFIIFLKNKTLFFVTPWCFLLSRLQTSCIWALINIIPGKNMFLKIFSKLQKLSDRMGSLILTFFTRYHLAP